MKLLVTILVTLFGLISYAQGKHQPKYEILEYGLAMLSDIKHFVDKEWNIKRTRVAGCGVTRSLIDSVDNHNRIVWKQIEHDMGMQNAEVIHHKQIRRESWNFKKIDELIRKEEAANAIWKGLKRKRSHFLVVGNHKKISLNVYEVTVKKWKRKVDGKKKNQVFKMKVDLTTGNVSILT